MAITESDILVMASERLTDDTDGGGRMSAVVVQSGVENNLFNDVSSVDRAQGALHLRKAFGWVNSTAHDALLGAHVILDDLADDPDVTAILVPATGPADKRLDLVGQLNNQGMSGKFYGTKTVQVDAGVGDRTVKVDGIETQLIPLGRSGTSVTGSIAAGATRVTGVVPVGSPVTVNVAGTLVHPDATWTYRAVAAVDAQIVKAVRAVSGSFSADITVDPAGVTPVVVHVTQSSATGLLANDHDVAYGDNTTLQIVDPYLHDRSKQNGIGDSLDVFLMPSGGLVGFNNRLLQSPTGHDLDIEGSYQPGLLASVPYEEIRIPIDSTNRRYVYNIALPANTLPGTETITCEGRPQMYTNGNDSATAGVAFGTSQFQGDFASTASINRFSGALTLVLGDMPLLDSEIVIGFGRKSATSTISSAALSGGGTFDGSGHLTVTLSAGRALESFSFYIGAIGYAGYGGDVYTGEAIVGAYNKTTGVISLPITSGTVSDWRGVQAVKDDGLDGVTNDLPPGLNPSGIVITGTTSAGAAFTATSNATGAFSTAVVTGSYAPSTGRLSLVFLTPVKADSLDYDAEQLTYSLTGLDMGGLNAGAFSATGKVPVLRPLDLVVVHREKTIAPATYANGNVVNIGEERISRLRVINSLGAVIATFVYGATGPAGVGCHADLVAGTLTIDSISGMSQPLTLKALIADMTTVSTAASDGTVKLSRALTHDYAAGSLVSSALLAGDTFSQVHDGWAQVTWTGVWSDTLIGSAPSGANYNEITNPIIVTNDGAITERWAIIFTSSVAFRVVGETVGEIATGNTSSVTLPMNPVTGEPYFTIPAAGWGSGWSVGNVYRFNTDSSTFPFWVVRTVMPSDQVTTVDSITVAVRGDIDNN